MPKLRVISGKDLMKSLLAEGFVLVRQKGSHVRLVFDTGSFSYYITIPLHDEIAQGTLKSIVRSLQKCFGTDKIEEIFYNR